MQIYDVSLPVSSNLPVWYGDPAVEIERFSKMEEGASCNVTQMRISAHAGTHVDAPYHFLGGAALTVDRLPLQILTGRAYVLRLPDSVELITAAVLEKAQIPPRTRRLLFRTRNSQIWDSSNSHIFQEDFVALSPDGAQSLIQRGIKLVGIDYLSIAPFADPAPTHEMLLRAGVVVVEGLALAQVSQGRYSMFCLPLKIMGADGAPARVILIGV